MATMKIDRFFGVAPRNHPTLLSDGMAVTAENVRLKNGKLVPLRNPSIVKDIAIVKEGSLSDIADANSIHIWRKYDGSFEFLAFAGVTWLCPGNLADDHRDRVIVSGDTEYSYTDEDNIIWENTPVVYMRNPDNGENEVICLARKNLSAPHVTRDSSEELDASHRYTYFFVTWVDKYGYESPISEPSKISNDSGTTWIDGELEYADGDVVNITLTDYESLVGIGAESVRIYKVITGSEIGRIQFIAEASRSQVITGEGQIAVVVKDEDAGEIIPEIESIIPDTRCIIDVPGGFYCGFSPSKPKTVCFSDVDLIYSWPIGYQYDVSDNIVALAATSNTVYALTDGWPYVLSGTDPSGMSVSKLAGPAACVSPRGVCVYRNGVYYVSNCGLMTIYNDANSGTVCANLTDKVFTKEQWLQFNPQECVMGQFDGALHLFFTLKDGSHKGLVVDLTESASAVTTHNEIAKCVCVDNALDKMYFVREDA